MMPFAHSDRSTVGIEWELQLIDSDSLDLRQCAEAVLAAIERQFQKQLAVVRLRTPGASVAPAPG